MLGQFPNQGVGFLLRKKDWVDGIHYEIRRAVYKVIQQSFSLIAQPLSLVLSHTRTTVRTQKFVILTLIASKVLASVVYGAINWEISKLSKTIMELCIQEQITKPS